MRLAQYTGVESSISGQTAFFGWKALVEEKAKKVTHRNDYYVLSLILKTHRRARLYSSASEQVQSAGEIVPGYIYIGLYIDLHLKFPHPVRQDKSTPSQNCRIGRYAAKARFYENPRRRCRFQLQVRRSCGRLGRTWTYRHVRTTTFCLLFSYPHSYMSSALNKQILGYGRPLDFGHCIGEYERIRSYRCKCTDSPPPPQRVVSFTFSPWF